VSALVLKPSQLSDNNISTRLMRWLTTIYEPVIDWALKTKQLVLGLATVLLAFSIYLFTTMGGEFVPTLDEGDFVIQPVLKTGTSLSKTVEITTKIEQVLLDNFPEVKQVITRIGAAEVPTDPMSMEESDVIIILKPKKEWTSANSKDELANKFKDALAVIPNMEVEFTQPIEMRFNELITGVRADIAIKLFGEDLGILSKKGDEIKTLIQNVEGAADITVEKIDGLPQMSVDYNRQKVARYGLNIEDLNAMLSMGFAGRSVGSVFEGEKRFDLVVRLDDAKRKDIENIKNLYVDLPNGGKIPLNELAEITYQEGAAKISRDDTKRRIVVGINVRNRDLESVVDDIKALIDKNVTLPVGYTITYGGQFENLQTAKARLLIAVPIALILIFTLLYFAFNSVKEALLIFSAIPLAAVGGVLFLWFRDMPFSISAGVGFIALFGIAVLNGIVLIEHFKALKNEGFTDMETLIKQGTKDRLRAVLLTASAAAFGFLPMAISTNAGAEVQRPLATVVIGGLITATLLTLVVLPVLYSYFSDMKTKVHIPKVDVHKLPIILVFVGLCGYNSFSQNPSKTLEELISMATESNSGLNATRLKVEQSDALIGSAFNFDKTEIFYGYDQNNLAINEKPISVFGIKQDLLFPTVYFAQKKLNKANYALENSMLRIKEKGLKRAITSHYYQYLYAVEKAQIYTQLDSLYQNFAKVAQRRFELGETNYLEKITAQSQQRQINLNLLKAKEDLAITKKELLVLVQSDGNFDIAFMPLIKIPMSSISITASAEIAYYNNTLSVLEKQRILEKQSLLPDITLEYFQGSNSSLNTNLTGYQIGLKIPLLFSGNSSRIKASKIAESVALEEFKDYELQLQNKNDVLLSQLKQHQNALDYFENEGEKLATEILKTANSSFKNGEIDFYQYIISLENAYSIQLNHLENLNNYNQTVITLNYLTL
jgi:cobalt-zinc-cadmium resistance protein CzcA